MGGPTAGWLLLVEKSWRFSLPEGGAEAPGEDGAAMGRGEDLGRPWLPEVGPADKGPDRELEPFWIDLSARWDGLEAADGEEKFPDLAFRADIKLILMLDFDVEAVETEALFLFSILLT